MNLSILIPARNEMFLTKTIQNVLENIRGDSEIIVVCDGNWPDPPIPDDLRVHAIYHSVPIGQRAAVNEAAKLSRAEFVMKLDAHCSVGPGFDEILTAECEYDWTIVPRMYNLHAFDWECQNCKARIYQGPKPSKCEKCEGTEFEMVVLWKEKHNPTSDFMRFDRNLHFQYWTAYKKRPEAQGDLAETMSILGACYLMHRERFWELGGLDEAHGSWGQMGTEIACKTWLSGGRLITNKKTWFAHMFRTQPGFGFPYPNHGTERAREYSRDLWLNNKWPLAIYTLRWLIKKFAPVPDWEDYISTIKSKPVVVEEKPKEVPKIVIPKITIPEIPAKQSGQKGIVYYTDNRLDSKIMTSVQKQLTYCANGHSIVSVSLQPLDFGQNIVLKQERSILTMFKEILAGLEASQSEIIFFCEHDWFYNRSHFEFTPPRDDTFYYNENSWKVDSQSGQALFYYCKQTAALCAYRDLLIEHYRKRIERVEKEGRYDRHIGFEPGCHSFPRGIDNYKAESWMSEIPNIDIRHGQNLTPSRWSRDQFRNQKYCQGWTLSNEVPGWGKTLGRMPQFLKELEAQWDAQQVLT